MRKALVLAILAMMTGPALAAPPTAAQQDEFYEVCFDIAENQTLCRCKADAAVTLIDAEFMAIVIAAMKGRAPANKSYVAYNEYVGRSNQICKPDY